MALVGQLEPNFFADLLVNATDKHFKDVYERDYGQIHSLMIGFIILWTIITLLVLGNTIMLLAMAWGKTKSRVLFGKQYHTNNDSCGCDRSRMESGTKRRPRTRSTSSDTRRGTKVMYKQIN